MRLSGRERTVVKKFIVFIIIVSILFSSSCAMAAKSRSAVGEYASSDIRERNALRVEVQKLSQKITVNKIKLQRMISSSNKAYNRAKANIVKILKKKDKLMQIEIKALRGAISSLEKYKDKLNIVNYSMENDFNKLERAKKQGDLMLQKQIMNRILDLQNRRIQELRKIIRCMNEIAKM